MARFRLEVVAGEVFAQQGEGFVGSIGDVEELAVAGRDSSFINKNIEIQDLVPVGGSVENDGHLLGQLAGLGESEDLEHFVEGSKAAREDDERFRQIGEPVLTHEKVM